MKNDEIESGVSTFQRIPFEDLQLVVVSGHSSVFLKNKKDHQTPLPIKKTKQNSTLTTN